MVISPVPALALLMGVLLLPGARAAEDQAAASPERPLADWISQLADEDFAAREVASEQLWHQGEIALPALREAADGDDPEKAVRASELIERIELGIRPDSDPKLIGLIASYSGANHAEKRRIYESLQNMDAWRQILGLYSRDNDPVIRKEYQPRMRSIVLHCARQELRAGRIDHAREILAMAPTDTNNLLMLADFLRHQGLSERELQRLRGKPGAKSAAWRLALLRVSGRLDEARHEALLANEPDLHALLAAMTGDPVPWIELVAQDTENRAVREAYSRMATARWSGRPMNPADTKELRSEARGTDMFARNLSVNSLFLIGQTDVAEAALVTSSPLTAFWYFNSLERFEDALAILGLNSQQMLDANWVDKQLKDMAANRLPVHEHQITASNQLATLAAFFEFRGMIDEAVQLIGPRAIELAETDQEVVLGLIRKFRGHDYPMAFTAPITAARIGAMWAGDDAGRWKTVVNCLFEDNQIANDWWQWMEALDPKATPRQRLDGLLAVLRLGPDPEGVAERWLKLAWAAHDRADGELKTEINNRLLILGSIIDDGAISLKAMDQGGGKDNRRMVGTLFTQLGAAGRWEEAAQLIIKSDGAMVPHLHGFAAAALRRAGNETEAAKHDALADMLCLGDARTAYEIGNGYAFGLDLKRARAWWWKSLCLSDATRDDRTNESHLQQSISRCALSLIHDPEHWLVAASLQETVCSMLTGRSYQWEVSSSGMIERLKADMFRLIARAGAGDLQALQELDDFHRAHQTNGLLADYFFPMLRQAGFHEQHDAWFERTWQALQPAVSRFPRGANSRNTVAWFASRAQLKLKQARALQTEALHLFPHQAAYLDTMAEIHFAMGNRSKAIQWSEKAMLCAPNDSELRFQHAHFLNDPLPRR